MTRVLDNLLEILRLWLFNKLVIGGTTLCGTTKQERSLLRPVIKRCCESCEDHPTLLRCAAVSLREAIEKNPRVWIYWYTLGDIYQKMGDWESSFHILKGCYKLWPDTRTLYALSTAQRFWGLQVGDIDMLQDALKGFTELIKAPLSSGELTALRTTIIAVDRIIELYSNLEN